MSGPLIYRRTLGGAVAQIPTDGLTNQWLFDGNASDSVGGNNGTVTGATLAQNRNGASNRCYYFDGNDVINLASDIILNKFSLSLWFNLDTVSTYEPLLGQFGNNAAAIAVPNSTTVRLYIAAVSFDWTFSFNTGTWYHMVMLREKVVTGRCYINNVQSTTGNRATGANNLTVNQFGRYSNSGTVYLNGYLDDIRIYDKILSESEISQLYNE